MSLLDGNPDHGTAPGLDHVAADDRVWRPIGALDEDVGLKRGDDLERRVFIEDHDAVDARKRAEELDALVLWRDRPDWALVHPNRKVRVHRYDQRIAELPCLLQVSDVAGMKQIEHAVGEHDLLATGLKCRYQGRRLAARHRGGAN